MDEIEVRSLREEDHVAVAELAARVEDGGAVAFQPQFTVGPAEAEALRHPGSTTVVAVLGGRVVGSAALSRCFVVHGEKEVRLAWLSGLQVDPTARRRGVARALTRARLDLADGAGEPTLVAAAVQRGNEASRRNAAAWASRSLGTVRVTPVPAPRRKGVQDVTLGLRPARRDELGLVAEGLASFARRHVLTPATTAAQLARDSEVTVGGTDLNTHVVAEDSAGRLVAGLTVENQALLSTMRVTRMPAALRLVNRVVHVVPPDGVMRNLLVKQPWFRQGQENSMRALFAQARRAWRDDGSSLVVEADPRGPLSAALGLPRWLPSVELEVVVREPAGVVLPGLPIGYTP